jgi:hemerythrin-like domain-containing protein
MTQPIGLRSLLPGPAATFEQPFEMLEACHERVHRMLALLERLRVHVRGHGADVQAQQAARDVMRYFDQAAPLHHEDEELHVFPPLLESGEPRVVGIVQRLQQDHREMASRWQAARGVLVRVAEGGVQNLSADDEALLDAFAGPYADHIAAEEQVVYPEARKVVDAAALARAGEEMMRRRGVK